jgi:ubiquinone/menaquinone biosynthesis C-methylase UbiE
VFDLGCGTADVTIRFVKAYPHVTAAGVDGSEEMLAFGRRHVLEAGLETRIRLEKRYLPDASLKGRGFDAAISNSLLHHLADPLTLWRSAAFAVKPASPVMVIDLVRPGDHQAAVELVNRFAPGAPAILRRDFLASLHAAYTIGEVRQQLADASLSHFLVQQVDEIHFVSWGRIT